MAAEGVGGDLFAPQQTFFDTGAVDFRDVVMLAVEGRQDLFDGFEQVLGRDLACRSLVTALGGIGDAVAAVVVPPRLNGAPGELAGVSVLVTEGHLADGHVAIPEGIAFGVFERAEDAHFEVIGDADHRGRDAPMAGLGCTMAVSCCCK